MAGHIADAARQDWCTPKWLLERVEEAFGGPGSIDLDPCSNELAIVPAKTRYILPHNDGLRDRWFGNVFVNPPFGAGEIPCKPKCKKQKCRGCVRNEVGELAGKCALQKCNHRGSHITEKVPGLWDWTTRMVPANGAGHKACIGLLPAAVDTRHWQKIIFPTGDAVCYLRGRVKFIGAKACAPMAIALPYWGPDPARFCDVFSGKIGRSFNLALLRETEARLVKRAFKGTIIVNGHSIELRPSDWAFEPTLADMVYKAIHDTHNEHHHEHWDVRTDTGDLLTNWMRPISEFGLSSGFKLYVSPPVGVGG